MIHANELRKNIWVIIDGEQEQLDEDALEVIFAARNYSDLSPIPLTPEILEKCGFEKTIHKYPLLQYFDYRLSNCVASVIESGIEIEYCGIDIEERTYITKIHSLHQLQNLYFALTGTELMYNPSTKEIGGK